MVVIITMICIMFVGVLCFGDAMQGGYSIDHTELLSWEALQRGLMGAV